ncbi:hypothetical protein [Myxococcus stipitatus]|uniref:hypothetical protein n=1 Tax=Myxococcus stipitatus TaxID=83455 RepID=UPI0030D01768
MNSKLSMTNFSERPLLVVIEPMAEDYILTPDESLVFIAQEADEEFYFSVVVRGDTEVLVYIEGKCAGVVAYNREGNVVEYGYNRHLNPDYPKVP